VLPGDRLDMMNRAGLGILSGNSNPGPVNFYFTRFLFLCL
jgi:hypothetical protein